MRRRSALIALLLLGSSFGPAAGFDLGYAKADGGQPGRFIDYGASARSMAMGQVRVGVTDDASAVSENPARLSLLQRNDFVAVYSAMEQSTQFGAASVAIPTQKRGVFGASLFTLQSVDFEQRNIIGEQTGTYDQSNYAGFLGYGISLGNGWSAGGALKGIRQQIAGTSGSGFGADAGVAYQASSIWTAGLLFQNFIPPTITLSQQSESYPFTTRIGAGVHVTKNVLLGVDLGHVAGQSSKLYWGGEWRPLKMLAVRAGINENDLTAGFGFAWKDVSLDYAFTYNDAVPGVSDLGGQNRIGFHVKFGGVEREETAQDKWQKKAQIALDLMAQQMDAVDETALPYDSQKLIETADLAMKNQGFTKPVDLYTVQGYSAFLEGEYLRSVQSLTEAVSLDESNERLKAHLSKAKLKMTEQYSAELIDSELKKLRAAERAKNYPQVIQSARKILAVEPSNEEAKTAMTAAFAAINEPVRKALFEARLKIGQRDYLGSIRYLQKVMDLEPTNKEAGQLMDQALAALEKNAAQPAVAPLVVSGEGAKHAAATELDIKKSRELYSQGLLLYSKGKVKDALETWKESLRYDESNTLARNAYNRAHAELKEPLPE